MHACGQHPHLVGGLAKLTGHASGRDGLLMQRLGPQWTNLAGPPSLETCTRDVYASDARWPAGVVLAMARGLAQALAHVHACALVHGDVYAHNVLHDSQGGVRLGDFGAATLLPPDQPELTRRMQALDVRALGCLFEELIDHCGDGPQALGHLPAWRDACLAQQPADRPSARDIAASL